MPYNIFTSPFFASQGLEDGIARHQGTITAMNTTGQEIIGKSAPVEADMLRDKLASQNRRWESICIQVADRRDRWVFVSVPLSFSAPPM